LDRKELLHNFKYTIENTKQVQVPFLHSAESEYRLTAGKWNCDPYFI